MKKRQIKKDETQVKSLTGKQVNKDKDKDKDKDKNNREEIPIP